MMQTLLVVAGATTSPVGSNHLQSPSANELYRELYHELAVDVNSDSTKLNTTLLSPVMADRFPSLDDFSPDQDEVTRNGTLNNSSVSANEDFLTRERALLGDDAAQFASANDHSTSATTGPDQEEDLLGGGNYGDFHAPGEDVQRFETSFPEVETRNETKASNNSINGSDAFARSQSYNQGDDQENEPEPIRQWRQRRDEELARRAEVSSKKKESTLAAAARWTDSFYEDYNKTKDKATSKARREAEEYLAKREDTAAGGTAWERVAKLVDLNVKGGGGGGGGGGSASDGKEKFRALLKDLRKDENAPGAKGY